MEKEIYYPTELDVLKYIKFLCNTKIVNKIFKVQNQSCLKKKLKCRNAYFDPNIIKVVKWTTLLLRNRVFLYLDKDRVTVFDVVWFWIFAWAIFSCKDTYNSLVKTYTSTSCNVSKGSSFERKNGNQIRDRQNAKSQDQPTSSAGERATPFLQQANSNPVVKGFSPWEVLGWAICRHMFTSLWLEETTVSKVSGLYRYKGLAHEGTV